MTKPVRTVWVLHQCAEIHVLFVPAVFVPVGATKRAVAADIVQATGVERRQHAQRNGCVGGYTTVRFRACRSQEPTQGKPAVE